MASYITQAVYYCGAQTCRILLQTPPVGLRATVCSAVKPRWRPREAVKDPSQVGVRPDSGTDQVRQSRTADGPMIFPWRLLQSGVVIATTVATSDEWIEACQHCTPPHLKPRRRGSRPHRYLDNCPHPGHLSPNICVPLARLSLTLTITLSMGKEAEENFRTHSRSGAWFEGE